MIKIKKAGDFELGFNCMTRLYMDGYDEEILNDMIKVCDEYLKWFSQETIYSSLFDLVRERHFYQNDEKVPEEQKERYESLIMALARQGICREKKNSQNREERIIILFGIEAGFLDSFFGKEKDFDLETFYWWVIDNNLNEEVEIKQVKADETLPIKKSFLPTFDKLCKYMIRYSYGRHSYMPSTSRDFVKANKELISDAALEDIICYLNKRNMNIPENEDFIIKNDSENWLYMQEELESELLTRKMFYMAQGKDGNIEELRKLLNGLLVFDSLHSQKDCLFLYNQVMGVERYLMSVPKNTNIQTLLKQLENEKKKIIKKRWEFFEKEEGQKYEKIGDGLYRRKRDYEIK